MPQALDRHLTGPACVLGAQSCSAATQDWCLWLGAWELCLSGDGLVVGWRQGAAVAQYHRAYGG